MYLHNINYRVFRDYKYEINDFQCDTFMFRTKKKTFSQKDILNDNFLYILIFPINKC